MQVDGGAAQRDLRVRESAHRRDGARQVGRGHASVADDDDVAGQPVGLLAPGYRADIVVLDADHPALIGREGDDVIDSWIFSGGSACVKDVFVAGQPVIQDRHHPREAEIEKAFRAAVKRLGE